MNTGNESWGYLLGKEGVKQEISQCKGPEACGVLRKVGYGERRTDGPVRLGRKVGEGGWEGKGNPKEVLSRDVV